MLIKISLRGAKQACPSESRGSNLKGFSLIELMVAVVILALAIFGIFHAYSVGFMGMADARDRTVATNYAREAMEDIKNMDFEKIISQNRNSIYIDGIKTKFEREVIVQESTNLKKVTTKVYWQDRNGNTKIVETDMLVHFMQTTAGTATRIMLFADPYNVLTDVGTSTLTAVIKDAKGNTVTTYNGDISFLITSGNGNLSSSPVSLNKGIANTTFTASASEGDVTIEASSGDLTTDSVTINVTNPEIPVKINLTASPIFMTTSSESLVTAKIVDAGGTTVTDATNEIIFTVSGPGTLSAPTTTPAVDGVATITLTSNGTPGTITVTASSSGLVPDFVIVITGGKIDLFTYVSSIACNEKAVIGITTKDLYGLLINYEGSINLSVTGYGEGPEEYGSGTLSPEFVIFNGDTYLETVDFTAYSEGKVKITATDPSGILDLGELILTINPALVPDHIAVYANPSSIEAGGIDRSTITARVKDENYITVTSYNESVTFTTDAGSFSNTDSLIEITTYFIDGVATVELYPSVIAGVATITVCSPSIVNCSISGNTNVRFYVEANHIDLVANPQNIFVGGDTCTITATIKDGEATVTGYSGTVEFSIDSRPGLFTTSGDVTVANGIAEIELRSKPQAGTVRIRATSSFTNSEGGTTNIEGYLNIPVGINLKLTDPSNITYENNQVSFDIEVQGAELLLEEMRVSWLSNGLETLNKIEIKSPYTADPIAIFDNLNNPASSGELINVEDIALSTGISNIKLYFNSGMSGKEFNVIFNPNSGNYSVGFSEST